MYIAAIADCETRTHTEFDAIQGSTGIFFPIQLMSGVIWPTQGMPKWVAVISYCLPTTWVANAFRACPPNNRNSSQPLTLGFF